MLGEASHHPVLVVLCRLPFSLAGMFCRSLFCPVIEGWPKACGCQ